MAFWESLKFQNLLNLTNSQLESLHDLIMVWLVIIIILAVFIGSSVLKSMNITSLSLDSATLEVVWTIIPVIILISIALPSLNLLCLQDTIIFSPKTSLKFISNQWNWQTESNENIDHLLDSEKLDELSNFEMPAFLPSKSISRLLLTSSDVLHSLGVPSLGLKLDSAPGRLNSVIFETSTMGLLPGSCYELCGSGHSAMPIFILLM